MQNLIGQTVTVTPSSVFPNQTPSIPWEGVVIAMEYYGKNQVSSYNRGWEFLVKDTSGKMHELPAALLTLH